MIQTLLRVLRDWRDTWHEAGVQWEIEQKRIDSCPYQCDNGEIHFLDGFGGAGSTPCDHGVSNDA